MARWTARRPRQRLLGVGEQRLGLVHATHDRRPHRLRQAQPRPGADQLGGQRRHPPVDRGALGTVQQGVEVLLDQAGGPDPVAGGQGVADGVVDQPVRLAPGGRRAVQPRHPLRVGLLQAGVEQVGEQVVEPPPAALPVQGDQEQVGPFGQLQQLLAVAAAGDRVAQRPGEPVQHRGLQQEPAERLGLAVQHLLGQVVQHVPVAARERGHEPGRVGMSLQRQPGKLQAGDPPFRAGRQGGHAAGGEVEPGGLVQQRGRLLLGEAQVGGAQLGELPAGAQPGQRQRRVGAAGHHQPQRSRQVLQQEAERLVDRLGLDEVVVVQHQRGLLGPGGQLVDDGGHHRLQRGRLGPAQQRGEPLTDRDPRPVQRGGDVAPEPHRVVVAGVQGQPRDRAPGMAGPVAEQAGLAEAGRRTDQRQLPRHPAVEPFQQPGAGEQARPRPRPRQVELGGQQEVGLGRGRLGGAHPREASSSRTGRANPLSCTSPASASATPAGGPASATRSLTSTWPGPACAAMRAARFTVRPK
jgi:hypothetical protein